MARSHNVPATAALDEAGVVGRDALEKVDAYLAGMGPDDQIEVATIARSIELLENEVAAALDAYVDEGVLTKEAVTKCSVSTCGATAPADEVREARADGDVFECPGTCEADLAADADATEIFAYIPVDVLPRVW